METLVALFASVDIPSVLGSMSRTEAVVTQSANATFLSVGNA